MRCIFSRSLKKDTNCEHVQVENCLSCKVFGLTRSTLEGVASKINTAIRQGRLCTVETGSTNFVSKVERSIVVNEFLEKWVEICTRILIKLELFVRSGTETLDSTTILVHSRFVIEIGTANLDDSILRLNTWIL